MIGVADEDRLGSERLHADDLSHDTVGIEERLTDVDAVTESAIDGEPLPVGIQIHGEDLRNEHALAHSGAGVQHGPQADVLRLQRGHALQPHVVVQLLGLELFVLPE